AALELCEKAIQRSERLLRPRVDPQLARGNRREVAHALSRPAECGVGLEGLERDGGEALQLRFKLRRIDEELGRREHGALDVVPAVLVACCDAAPGLLERGRQGGIAHDDRVGREVIEQRRRLLEEKRQIELDARGRQTLADAAVDRGPVRVSIEVRAETAPELPDRFGIERHLARRQEAHALERIERALRFRIEAADGLDLLIEKIDAQRRRCAHGEDIEERAAHGELSGARHLADARISGIRESLAKGLERQGLSAGELEGAALYVLPRRQALQERVRRDDEAAVAGLR